MQDFIKIKDCHIELDMARMRLYDDTSYSKPEQVNFVSLANDIFQPQETQKYRISVLLQQMIHPV